MSEEMKAKRKLLLSANKNGYDRLEGAALEQPWIMNTHGKMEV